MSHNVSKIWPLGSKQTHPNTIHPKWQDKRTVQQLNKFRQSWLVFQRQANLTSQFPSKNSMAACTTWMPMLAFRSIKSNRLALKRVWKQRTSCLLQKISIPCFYALKSKMMAQAQSFVTMAMREPLTKILIRAMASISNRLDKSSFLLSFSTRMASD